MRFSPKRPFTTGQSIAASTSPRDLFSATAAAGLTITFCRSATPPSHHTPNQPQHVTATVDMRVGATTTLNRTSVALTILALCMLLLLFLLR